MPIAKLNIGRFKQTSEVASDGSQDTSPWQLLTVSDITSTNDPGSLETSKAMSGDEFQFRGSAPPAAGSDDDPSDGCQYTFTLKDPRNGSSVQPADGGLIGIEFYFQFGSNYPAAKNEAFHLGIKEQTTTSGIFAGYKSKGNNQSQIASGTFASTAGTNYTWASSRAGFIQLGMFDDSSSGDAVFEGAFIFVFDDPSTPARVEARLGTIEIANISNDIDIVASFAGDVDVTMYYRLVYGPANPF